MQLSNSASKPRLVAPFSPYPARTVQSITQSYKSCLAQEMDATSVITTRRLLPNSLIPNIPTAWTICTARSMVWQVAKSCRRHVRRNPPFKTYHTPHDQSFSLLIFVPMVARSLPILEIHLLFWLVSCASEKIDYRWPGRCSLRLVPNTLSLLAIFLGTKSWTFRYRN